MGRASRAHLLCQPHRVARVDLFDTDHLLLRVDGKSNHFPSRRCDLAHHRAGHIAQAGALSRQIPPRDQPVAKPPEPVIGVASQDTVGFEANEETMEGTLGQT